MFLKQMKSKKSEGTGPYSGPSAVKASRPQIKSELRMSTLRI
jgi:hypothetical protein